MLWLVDLILASGDGVLADEYDMVYFPGDDLFASLRPRGLPIGNLTSQFWSNVYMNALDWYVVRELGCPAYLRYVDDFALFADGKRQLWEWKTGRDGLSGDTAADRPRVRGPGAAVASGIPWLGFVVYPTHRRLKRRNVVNFARRLAANLDSFQADGSHSPSWMPACKAGSTTCATAIPGACAVRCWREGTPACGGRWERIGNGSQTDYPPAPR